MDTSSRWIFTKEQIVNSPSRKCRINFEKEIKFRQQCSSFIQDLSLSLKLTQLCTNTAIVYMHRFFMIHSMTKYEKYKIGIACLFLATKTEDSIQRMETVIFEAHKLLYKKESPLTLKSERYLKMTDELLLFENILLMTLGFDVQVDHPHPTIVTSCDLIKADKELKATSYYMATNSLHLTTMCLQYRPSVVACFAIYISSKWLSYDIPLSSFGKPWFTYVDPEVTFEILDQMTYEFLDIYEKTPTKLRRMIQAYSTGRLRHLSSKQKSLQNQTQTKTSAELQKSLSNEKEKLKDQLMMPLLPLSETKSIFSPLKLVTEEKLQPRINQDTLLPLNAEPVAVNCPESLHSENPRKRRISTDENCSPKRVCVSNNTEESSKLSSNSPDNLIEPQSSKSSDSAFSTTSGSDTPLTSSSSENEEKDTEICLNSFLNNYRNNLQSYCPSTKITEIENIHQNSLVTSASTLEKDKESRTLPTGQEIPQTQSCNLQVTQQPLTKVNNLLSFSMDAILENSVSSKVDQTCTLNPIINYPYITPVKDLRNASGERNLLVINNVVEKETWNNQDISCQLPKNNVLEVSSSIVNTAKDLINKIPEKEEDSLEKETKDSSRGIKISENEVAILAERMENSVNMSDVPQSTIHFSQNLAQDVEENNNNALEECRNSSKEENRNNIIEEKCRNDIQDENKEKHRSKKSKKEKKEKKDKQEKKERKQKKKDKERKKDKRKDKVREHKQICDKKTNDLRAAPMTSIKISIPKEKLNLNDSILFPESKLKSSQENSLKIKIPKELILDTNFDLPSTNQSVTASLSFQFDNERLEKKTSELTWTNHQHMKQVFN